jgi:oxygen-dependent protoporphyrinogen oxidase
MSRRIVVVGGGISGIAAATSAASTARAAGEPIEVLLIEREASVGGKARSLRRNGWLVEGGPAAFLDEPETAGVMHRLLEAAALDAEVVRASVASQHRFLVRGGRLREVEPHPLRFAGSGILGPGGLLRLLLEPLVGRRNGDADESVYEFAARRIGRQAAERLVAPMVLGVFAGDARRLSLRSAFPRLLELEREHGSLVRGMVARRRRGRPGGGPAGPAGGLLTLRDGLQSLPLALEQRGGFAVRRGTTVDALVQMHDGRWQVRLSDGDSSLAAEALIVATEAWASAALLEPLAPEAAVALASIPYPGVAVVALGYGPEISSAIPYGFGVLVPRGEGARILGCVWDSRIFTGRSPSGHVLVRAMLGGTVDPDVASLADDELVEMAHADLHRLLRVSARPVFHEVVRWPRAIPQYEIGHEQKLEAVDRALAGLPGLDVTGNALRGVAFSKAAHHAWACGERAARRLLAGAPRTASSSARSSPPVRSQST